MRILTVVNGYPPSALGGVEVYTADITKTLYENGHEILVICRETDISKPDYHVTQEILSGIQVIRIINDFKETETFSKTYQNPTINNIFSQEIKRFYPEIIHFHHMIALSAGMPQIAESYNCPYLITLHDYWAICQRVQLIDWKGRWCPGPLMGGDCARCVQGSGATKRWIKTNLPRPFLKFIRKLLGKSLPEGIKEHHFEKDAFGQRYNFIKKAILGADRVLVPSEYMRNQYEFNGYPRNKMEVLPLGINIPAGSPSKIVKKDITFGFIGSLLPIKGVHTLIHAFRTVPMDNLSLEIHGRDDLYPASYVQKLKELAEGDQRIHFRGSFDPDQRNQIYSNIDVLIIPSIAPETFSLVAREALVRGIPVIASMIGALPEIIIHGINGYLFNPDDTNSLANFINHLAKNPKVLANFSVPGPINITSMNEHIQNLESIYRKISQQNSSETIPAA